MKYLSIRTRSQVLTTWCYVSVYKCATIIAVRQVSYPIWKFPLRCSIGRYGRPVTPAIQKKMKKWAAGPVEVEPPADPTTPIKKHISTPSRLTRTGGRGDNARQKVPATKHRTARTIANDQNAGVDKISPGKELLLRFVLEGFGLAALAEIAISLFTPCVFPMIPITVSFSFSSNRSPEAISSPGWRWPRSTVGPLSSCCPSAA